jgi:hypothetical protein
MPSLTLTGYGGAARIWMASTAAAAALLVGIAASAGAVGVGQIDGTVTD